jgi:hypothetical protein
MSLAGEKCGCEREVQLPHENDTFMMAEKYMALHKVAGMVLLGEEYAPVGSLRLDLGSDPWQSPSDTPGYRPTGQSLDRQRDALTLRRPRRPRGPGRP